MTLAELLTDLESKPDVLEVLTPVLLDERENVKRYDVPIVKLIGDDLAQGASQPIIVLNEGLPEEVAYYNVKKNFTEAQRAQLYTDAQYINGLESEFVGWKVLKLSVAVDGDMDVLSVRASDGNNIIEKRVGVWNNASGNPQWKEYE